MRVDHGKIERREEQVRVSDGNEHGVIGSWLALIHQVCGLVCVTRVGTGADQWSIGQIELGNPCDKGWDTSLG